MGVLKCWPPASGDQPDAGGEEDANTLQTTVEETPSEYELGTRLQLYAKLTEKAVYFLSRPGPAAGRNALRPQSRLGLIPVSHVPRSRKQPSYKGIGFPDHSFFCRSKTFWGVQWNSLTPAQFLSLERT